MLLFQNKSCRKQRLNQTCTSYKKITIIYTIGEKITVEITGKCHSRFPKYDIALKNSSHCHENCRKRLDRTK